MSSSTRRLAVRSTSWSLAATAALLPATGGGLTYVGILVVAGCVVALVAATQIRHDDALGWLAAVAAASSIGALVTAARTDGLPGHHTAGWDLPSGGTVALCAAVLVTAAACTRARRGEGTRIGSVDTLRS